MHVLLELEIDGEVVLEFDRNARLPGRQRDFLDKMDEDMDKGIQLAGRQVSQPDRLQRAQYVAMHLLQAFRENNQGMINATAAYLSQRLPELKRIQVQTAATQGSLELILDG